MSSKLPLSRQQLLGLASVILTIALMSLTQLTDRQAHQLSDEIIEELAGTTDSQVLSETAETASPPDTPTNPSNIAPTQTTVTRIIDGDTIELETGHVVRYIGIDTPETKHPQIGQECFGQEASTKNAELVLNQTVTLETDVNQTDRYGRLLRYIYLEDGTFVNFELVAQGYAEASAYPPDVKYQDQLAAAERTAREQQLGLWGEACQL